MKCGSLSNHFSNFDFGAAVIIIFRGNAAPDGFYGTPVIAGRTVLAAMLPDRFFIRHHDIVDRTDFLANTAAGAFFSDAEAGIIKMNELIHAQVWG